MRICFVGGGAGALAGTTEGGLEGQVALLASNLAALGHEVTLVSTGLCDPEHSVRGVRVVPGWAPGGGPRGLRFLTHRLPSLAGVLERTGADVFYSRGFSLFAPAVVSAARRSGAPSLLALASDSDIMSPARLRRAFADGRPPRGFGVLAHLHYRLAGLRRASMVLVQTREQEARCLRLGMGCRLLRNAFEPPGSDPEPREPCDAVWVGRLSPFKGVRELVELARSRPGMVVSVVGDADPSMSQVIERLAALGNVRMLGRLTREGTLSAIAGAGFLLNTSPLEGFSNAFLEAWFLGKPVVSLHANPDGILDGGPFGACANGCPDTLAALAGEYAAGNRSSPVPRPQLPAYVTENHSTEKVLARLLELVEGLRISRS